jgi:uncharacterized protein YoxC
MSQNYVCNFCKKTFSSKSNLSAHQKRAKKCLVLQDSTFDHLFECEKCGKMFTTKQNMKEHGTKCSLNIEKMYGELDTKYKILENTMKMKLKEKEQFILEKEKQIHDLQEQVKHLQETLSAIAEIGAKKNTNTHTYNLNTNIVNQLVPYDLNKQLISSTVNEHFNENHLCGEENGIALFAVNNLLKDKDGNYKMMCTDVARKIFVYKDDEGNVYKDVNADGFLELYIPAVAKKSYAMIATKEVDEMLKLSECITSIKPAIVSTKIASKLVPKPNPDDS